jgi:hypothetical protein
MRPTVCSSGSADGLDGKAESIDAVADDHVERRRGRSLLPVAANVKSLGIRAAVNELVKRALVAVEGEDDGAIGGEEVENCVSLIPCGVLLLGEERLRVDWPIVR